MGTKKHLLVEQQGGPPGVVIDGANANDHKLLEPTIGAVVIKRPDPEETAQHLCVDKAYDNKATMAVCEGAGYVPEVRRIGEEKLDEAGERTHPARRWVVERTIAWLQRCRAIIDSLPEAVYTRANRRTRKSAARAERGNSPSGPYESGRVPAIS